MSSDIPQYSPLVTVQADLLISVGNTVTSPVLAQFMSQTTATLGATL